MQLNISLNSQMANFSLLRTVCYSYIYFQTCMLIIYHAYTHRFIFWGVVVWKPVGIRRICVKDDTCCECKKCSDITSHRECVRTTTCPDSMNDDTFCYWMPSKDARELAEGDFKVFSLKTSFYDITTALVAPKVWGHCDCCKETLCEKGQYFDKRLCKCICRKISCPRPYIQDPDTCQCVCPVKSIKCGHFKKLDPCKCRCVCKPFFCFSPRIRNQKTCRCECPRKVCHRPLVHDPSTCRCRCPRKISCRHGYRVNHRTCRCYRPIAVG